MNSRADMIQSALCPQGRTHLRQHTTCSADGFSLYALGSHAIALRHVVHPIAPRIFAMNCRNNHN